MQMQSEANVSNHRVCAASTTIVYACCAAILVLLCGCTKKESAGAPATPEVDVVDAVQQDVPVFQEWVAQLNGETNAQITPKVQGYLLRQAYRDGSFVKKGELLFEIDQRPLVAALDQAVAQLAVAKANLARAETDVTRDTPLAAQNAIPLKQLDTHRADMAASKASVQAAQAQVEQAKLNLAWTKVFSPIAGIAGKAESQVGDLVGTTTKMTVVSQVNPIRAYFSVSESMFLQIAPKVTQILRSGRHAGKTPVDFIQANGITYPKKGLITLVNREISAQTGTIQLAAEFPNPDAVLRPGGFGQVRIQTGTDKGVLLVPQRAVLEVQSMYQVVVVGPENKVAFRPVKVKGRVGQNYVVSEGLKPGERVVAQGFMKLKDGMSVSPKPSTVAAATEGH
jgi:membrane fusion protein (multidrug efflux system)